jgi:hypothetical protein
MGKTSRDKGAAFERQVARDLTLASGVEHKRNLTEVREGNSGDVLAPLPVSIQCKVGKRPPLYEALAEAKASAAEGELPVAVIHRNGNARRSPDRIVILDYEDFLKLYAPVMDHLSGPGED